jgi:hypothetical protein
MIIAASSGCAAFSLDPPAGFAQVSKDDSGARMKAGDDVGLNVSVFDNVEGGTLAFWSEDLVRKLGRREYTLARQSPVRSKNNVDGTRFDFTYTPPGTQEAKFYSVALFVTDEHLVVVQLAGDAELADRHRGRLDAIAGSTKVRGCRPWTDICDGPQPTKLQTPVAEVSEAEGRGG